MQVQLRPAYIPWLFDSRDAWEKSVRDPRYRYDMTFDAFMAIYNEYRGNGEASRFFSQPTIEISTPVANTPAAVAPSQASQLLSQNEIDDLIAAMAH